MQKKSEIVTIKDVAKKAGVSISTVSRVLNGLDRVSDTTRKKVSKAIEEMEFTHNPVAASMITKKTHIILVVVPDFINTFFASVIQGIEDYLKSRAYYVMVNSTGDVKDVNLETLKSKFGPFVDGIIAIPSEDNFLDYRNWGKPCVIVDRYVRGSGMDAVIADNYGGAYMLTETLIKAHHKKIAMIIRDTKLCVGEERLRGFLDALKDHGIKPQKKYIRYGDMYQTSGKQHLRELMSLSDPPTAVFAGNNLICEGCILAAREMGLTIGKDFSLVGFDDHLMAQTTVPGITVVEAPSLQLGQRAAKRLLELLYHVDIPENEREVILDVQLILRESVKTL